MGMLRGRKKRSRHAERLAMTAALGAMRDQATWLLTFANRDLSATDPEDIDALRWELLAFVYFPQSGLKEIALELRDIVPAIHEAEEQSRRSPLHGPSAEREIRRIHGRLRTGLTDLFRGRPFYGDEKVRLGVERKPNGSIVRARNEDEEAAFFTSVFQILARLGSQLRVCRAPGCERFFAAERPRQQYCRPACAQRVRSARFYAAHQGPIRAKRKAGYEGDVRQRLGPNTRVGRRPPKTPR